MKPIKVAGFAYVHTKYQQISLYIYILSLGLIATGLLFSRGMISIGFISFAANWIIEGGFYEKWEIIKKNKAGIIISAIIVLHLLGMLHTQNTGMGFKDLKIKLPLLLPIFYVSAKHLVETVKPKYFLVLFITACFVASIIAFFKFEYNSDFQSIEDLNEIALIGQNIRLSLFINLSLFSLIYFLYKSNLKISLRLLMLIPISWFIVFIYLLNSLTGHLIFIVLIFFSAFYFFRKTKIFVLFVFTLLAIIILAFVHLHKVVTNFNSCDIVDYNALENQTINNNPYLHDTLSNRTENGHFIDIYVCEKELKNEWNKVSSLSFEGKDEKGQELRQTMIRYLSSKGLRKDSLGFNQLTKNDIRYIEKGCANYKYNNKYSFESRVYNILWQLKTYRKTGNATAQSISQRLEFTKTAWLLIQQNFWFGVGTGDVMDDFGKELEKRSSLEAGYRNRVHNQYLVELVTLGIFGFLAFLFVTLFPIFWFKIWKNYLFSIFYIIILLSYFTDNTLEIQLGVGFFALFYSIFCFDLSVQSGKLH